LAGAATRVTGPPPASPSQRFAAGTATFKLFDLAADDIIVDQPIELRQGFLRLRSFPIRRFGKFELIRTVLRAVRPRFCDHGADQGKPAPRNITLSAGVFVLSRGEVRESMDFAKGSTYPTR
jgi:hypothetical protein